MRRKSCSLLAWVSLGVALFCACISSGCIGLTSQLIYMVKGQKVDPEFPGLKGKKVAVVCVANTSTYDPASAAAMLGQSVEAIMRQKLEGEIKLVRQSEISDWIDRNNWDQMDYRDIGRGVNAQMVLAIDLQGYRLHEDQTLFRGRANVTVTVYDMSKGGEPVFRRTMPNFCFPVNGGQHVSETNEAQFQRKFIVMLANEISKYFCPYELKEDFARDSAFLDQ